MAAEALLWFGTGSIALAVTVAVLAFLVQRPEPAGVARSLLIIDQTRQRREVALAELPFSERIGEPVLRATRAIGSRFSPAGTVERLERNLDFAGNPQAWSVERLLGVKGAGLLVGLLLGAFVGGLGPKGFLFAAVGGAGLFFLPDLLVHNTGTHRQQKIKRTLPDALDMLTVCVEAGLGFDSALLQVARNTEGPLAGEFARVLQEMQIGKSRQEAFAALSGRTNVDALDTFVSALTQADRLGIPIANVLREQSKEMRLIRRQSAEEQAQKVPVKIVFPLILCIFPALFVVIIGPGAIGIMQAFSGI